MEYRLLPLELDATKSTHKTAAAWFVHAAAALACFICF